KGLTRRELERGSQGKAPRRKVAAPGIAIGKEIDRLIVKRSTIAGLVPEVLLRFGKFLQREAGAHNRAVPAHQLTQPTIATVRIPGDAERWLRAHVPVGIGFWPRRDLWVHI